MRKYENDLSHIRQMMERSSTFISLSGLSGIGAGLFAMVGCAASFWILERHGIDYFDGKPNIYGLEVLRELAVIAALTFGGALFISYHFTSKKAKAAGLSLWNTSAKNTMISLAIPLIAGGIFCIVLTFHQLFYLVAPCMLIFYGLALVGASRYTHRELFWLGILELILGLVASILVGYGLLFWGLGFGVLHIIYGIIMYKKYQ